MSTFRDQQVEEAAQLARRMRVLKWVVLILGILLVLAMVTTVVGVIYKARHGSVANTQSPGAVAGTLSGTMPGGFGAASLPVPAACQISSATASGDRLILITTGPSDQCRLILVADLKSGRLIGQFTFQAP